jgi:hypothetical protein
MHIPWVGDVMATRTTLLVLSPRILPILLSVICLLASAEAQHRGGGGGGHSGGGNSGGGHSSDRHSSGGPRGWALRLAALGLWKALCRASGSRNAF